MIRLPNLIRLACLMGVWGVVSPAATITADFSVTTGNFVPSNGLWAHTATSWDLTSTVNMDSNLASPTFTASGGAVTLQFTHTYNFEAGFDGGMLELSVNGGAFSYVPGSSFSQNGYTGTGVVFGNVPLFNGSSGGPRVSIVSLGTLAAGTDFAFRFRAGSDSVVLAAQPNWSFASVTLTNTESEPGFSGGGEVPEPSTAVLLALGGIGLGWMSRRRARR